MIDTEKMRNRQERQKSDWICAVCDGGPGNYCNCSCPNGPVKQNTGSWLPSPGKLPSDLAPAQMVELHGWEGNRVPARKVAWEVVSKYRPLYSEAGLPLCSAEGLHDGAKYVCADGFAVWQTDAKSRYSGAGWSGDGFSVRAPSTHRRPGDWRSSLMEVMR